MNNFERFKKMTRKAYANNATTQGKVLPLILLLPLRTSLCLETYLPRNGQSSETLPFLGQV